MAAQRWTLATLNSSVQEAPQSLAASKLALGNGREGGGGNERSSKGEGTHRKVFYTHSELFCLGFLGYIYFLLVSEVPALDNYCVF